MKIINKKSQNSGNKFSVINHSWNDFSLIVLLFVLVLFPFDYVDSALSISGTKRCGTRICDLNQYCSRIHNQCEACDVVCESMSHNFDEDTCSNHCQDYIYEQRYLKSSNYSGDIRRLEKQQLIISILLVILLILTLVIHGTQCIRWMRRHGYFSRKLLLKGIFGGGGNKKSTTQAEMMTPEQFTHANPHTQSPKMNTKQNQNGVGGTGGIICAETGTSDALSQFSNNVDVTQSRRPPSTIYSVAGSVQTATTPLSRHPAEDSTLDFSYDNQALQQSPTTSEKPKTETTF